MAEKLITSRVKQRFDTLTNWQAIWATFKPLKGEVCKVQIPANTAVTGLRTSSSVRVMTKTGDGETTLENLPWDSAIGADETQLSKGTDSTTSKTLSHGGTFTAITDIGVSGHTVTDKPTTFTLPSETTLSVTDTESGNAVTDVTVSGHAITLKRGKTFLTAHPTIGVGTDSTSAATLAHSGTFTAVDSVTRDGNGHVTKINTKTYTLPADSDTKNTAGGGNTSSKIYLVGTLKQETGVSYTHDTAYVGTDGCLYSGGNKVLTSYTDTKNTAGSTNTSSKIYLVGATSQAANPQTYSHDTAYVGTDGHLYSNNSKVFSNSYAPEAYLQWGGKNFAGSWGPIDAAMVPNFAANRFAFLPASAITSEYSTDGGSTWTATTAANAKQNIFANGGLFTIGNNTSTGIDKAKYKCRITITTSGVVYTALNKFAIRITTNGSTGCHVKIESRTKANQDAGTNTWVTNVERAELQGWSGWNIINTSSITTHGNRTDQYSQLRFTFGVDSHASTVTYGGMQVLRIMAFGGEGWTTCSNMAADGHLYSYDAGQNATFPAGLNTVGQLKENGTRVSKLGHTHSVTAAGTVSQPSFTGTAASHDHSFTGTEAGHTHTFSGTAASHDHSFTGTKHKHTFTGTAVTSGGASATASIYQITGVGTLPSLTHTASSLTATVSNQCLTLTFTQGSATFSAGTLPTRSSITVAKEHTHSVTAAGTLDEIAATGTVGSKSITPAGTINETKITPAGSISSKSLTPAGTVSKPTFTGTAVTSGGSSN